MYELRKERSVILVFLAQAYFPYNSILFIITLIILMYKIQCGNSKPSVYFSIMKKSSISISLNI